MLYEMRTYTFAAGGAAEFERGFGEALEYRNKYSQLGGFWRTELGPLNEVVHIWPYEDLNQRSEARAASRTDAHWPPKHDAEVLRQESEILVPAPFMDPWEGPQALGAVYELRSYTYRPGKMPEVIKRWAEVIEYRKTLSPLAGAWHTDIGTLNKWVHLWAYDSLDHRASVRAEAVKGGKWPASTRDLLLDQETKILIPASFSPMH
jgi:hypothetical protein